MQKLEEKKERIQKYTMPIFLTQKRYQGLTFDEAKTNIDMQVRRLEELIMIK